MLLKQGYLRSRVLQNEFLFYLYTIDSLEHSIIRVKIQRVVFVSNRTSVLRQHCLGIWEASLLLMEYKLAGISAGKLDQCKWINHIGVFKEELQLIRVYNLASQKEPVLVDGNKSVLSFDWFQANQLKWLRWEYWHVINVVKRALFQFKRVVVKNCFQFAVRLLQASKFAKHTLCQFVNKAICQCQTALKHFHWAPTNNLLFWMHGLILF